MAKDSYSLLELIEANMRSGDWVTCACGQAANGAAVSSGQSGRPNDNQLFRLGIKFHESIQTMIEKWDSVDTTNADLIIAQNRASEILKSIETRIKEICLESKQGNERDQNARFSLLERPKEPMPV